jgi:hypothetical protein
MHGETVKFHLRVYKCRPLCPTPRTSCPPQIPTILYPAQPPPTSPNLSTHDKSQIDLCHFFTDGAAEADRSEATGYKPHCVTVSVRPQAAQRHCHSAAGLPPDTLEQYFSTAGPWHQLYRAARICHFSFLSIFHE